MHIYTEENLSLRYWIHLSQKACLFLGKKKAIILTQKSGLYCKSLAYWYTAFICRKGIRWEGAPFISTYLYNPVHGNCISSFLNVVSLGLFWTNCARQRNERWLWQLLAAEIVCWQGEKCINYNSLIEDEMRVDTWNLCAGSCCLSQNLWLYFPNVLLLF